MPIVLNWFTQGVAVAIVAAAALRLIPRSRAQARYAVAWAALLLVAILPAVPAIVALAPHAPTLAVPAAAGAVVTVPATWWTSPAVAIGFWIACACVHTVRLGLSALGIRRAKRRGRACPADALARLPHWSRLSLTGRPTPVILSGQVRAAAVLGGGTPTIALAPTLIDQLSVDDLDRVLVHEWAHVQRRDDVAQLAQRILRVLVGWHPAAWWIERQLEFEREAACDEVVVAVTGSARGYAACLTALAGLPQPRLRLVPALAAAAPSRLGERVVRILAMPRVAAARPWRAITVCGGVGLFACTLAVGHVQLVAAAVESAAVSSIASAQAALPVLSTVLMPPPATERTDRSSDPVVQRRSKEKAQRAARTDHASLIPDTTVATAEPSFEAAPHTPSPAPTPSVDPVASTSLAPHAPEPPADTASEGAAAEPTATDPARAVWSQAADTVVGLGRVSRDAGTVTGRASLDAGTATGRFFTRLGKKIAGAF